MSDIVIALDNAFHGRGWQGPTLLGCLRGVTAAEAQVIPARLKHSIWHNVLHAAYWKYAVCLRLSKAGVTILGMPMANGEPSFPRSPSNWPNVQSGAPAKQWKADIDLLRSMHAALIDAAGRLSKRQLDSIPPGGRTWTLRPMLLGVAAHDAYHCGQIQLLKRLVRNGGSKAARG